MLCFHFSEFTPQIAQISTKTESPRVRIAFLLTLNGRAVRQVHRLLKLLYSDQHYYYIHVDAVSSECFPPESELTVVMFLLTFLFFSF